MAHRAMGSRRSDATRNGNRIVKATQRWRLPSSSKPTWWAARPDVRHNLKKTEEIEKLASLSKRR